MPDTVLALGRGGDGMSALLGADTRSVDVIAEGLRGRSEAIQDLRTMAQRAVAEMRNAWAGPDFESIAQRWEQEAAPRLTDVSTALSTMASALRAQAEEQRHTSGNTGSPSFPAGAGGRPDGLAFGDHFAGSTSTFINGHLVRRELSVRLEAGAGVPDPTLSDRVRDNVKLNLAQADVGAEASLASMKWGDDNAQFALSAARVEASAGSSLDIDAHGNLVGSAEASAAGYLAYAAGKLQRGSDFANGTLGGKAYVGAEARADASGSIGPQGAKGHLGAEAFAGAKVELDAGATLAGVTAEAGGEISYGVGAHADVDVELSATGVGVSVDLGAALGLGAGVKFDVSVNPQEVIANVGEVAEDIGDAAEAVGNAVSSAVGGVASLFKW
jgi:uncharacterized protein YukE